MKNIIKIILTITLAFSSAYALKKDDIKVEMTNKINNIISILENKELKKDLKVNEIVKILDGVFDYKTMAKISLGKRWKTLSEEKQNEFTKAFENKLKNSYIGKLDLYTNQKIEILDLVSPKKNRLKLESQIIGKDKTYNVSYDFFNKKGDWLIYNVNLAGVNILKTYRIQFSGFLKTKTIDELIENLKDNQ